jgi:hypothetical protein
VKTLNLTLQSGECGLTDGSTAGQWRLPMGSDFKRIGSAPPPTTWPDMELPPVVWTISNKFENVIGDYYWTAFYDIYNNIYVCIDLDTGLSRWNYEYNTTLYNVWPVRKAIP